MIAKPNSLGSLISSIADSPWMIYEPAFIGWFNAIQQDPAIRQAWTDQDQFLSLLARLSKEQSLKDNMTVKDSVAYIKLQGVLQPKWNWISALFGETTLDVFVENFVAAQNNSRVKEIAFLVDSPGGRARGVEEASELLYEARGYKPMTSYVSGLMTSASYFIGSTADRIVATPTSTIGNIGSILVHSEISKMADMVGIKFTPIFFGEFKADGNQYQQLSDAARKNLQRYVDESGQAFVEAVARNRGISVTDVRSRYGDGQFFLGKLALERGLIDEVRSNFDFASGILVDQKSGAASMADQQFVTKEEFDRLAAGINQTTGELREMVTGLTGTIESVATQISSMAEDSQRDRRNKEIETICKQAGCLDRAAGFINSGASLEAVRSELFSEMLQNRQPDTGEAGGSDDKSREARYRTRWAGEEGETWRKMGLSFEEFVADCKVQDNVATEEPIVVHSYFE